MTGRNTIWRFSLYLTMQMFRHQAPLEWKLNIVLVDYPQAETSLLWALVQMASKPLGEKPDQEATSLSYENPLQAEHWVKSQLPTLDEVEQRLLVLHDGTIFPVNLQ